MTGFTKRLLQGAAARAAALAPAWCRSPYASASRVLAALLLAPAALLALHATSLGEAAEFVTARRAEFKVREALGAGRHLDPRIKVFAFDDETFAYTKTPDLGMQDWSLVIAALSRAGASRILIDKVFGQAATPEEAAAFNTAVGGSAAEVVTGAFIGPPIAGREPVDLAGSRFDPRAYGAAPQDQQAADAAFADRLVYAAAADLRRTLSAFGHLNFADNGYIYPVARLAAGRIVFHMAMLGAATLALDRAGRPVANGVPVPVDDRGRMLVDFIDPHSLAQRAFSMKALIVRARDGRPIDVVRAGDLVVILPKMYTGNADFFGSPFGTIAGGFHLLACVNSVLTGTYLVPSSRSAGAILVACLLGALMAAYLPVRSVWPSLLASAAVQAGVGMAAFIWLGRETPWLFTVAGACISGVALLAERSRTENLQKVRLDAEVETARLVQSLLLPKAGGAGDGLRVASAFSPASECSGDWWRHGELGERYFVILADAAGHGVSAALISAMAHATVATCVAAAGDVGAEITPMGLAARLNRVLHETGDGGLFMSCLIMAFAKDRRSLSFVNAGMPRPVLASGTTRALLNGGTPLGILADLQCKEQTVALRPGDKLVLFSDGLTEARDKDWQMWGTKHIKQEAGRDAASPEELRDRIMAGFRRHGKGTVQADDVTLIVIAVDGEAAPLVRAGNG